MIAFALYTRRRARRFICPWGLFIWSYGKHWPSRSRPITYGNGGVRLTFSFFFLPSPVFLSFSLYLSHFRHLFPSASTRVPPSFSLCSCCYFPSLFLYSTLHFLLFVPVHVHHSFLSPSFIFHFSSSNSVCRLRFLPLTPSLFIQFLSFFLSFFLLLTACAFIGPAAYHNTNDRWTLDPCSILLPRSFLPFLALAFVRFLRVSCSCSLDFPIPPLSERVHRRAVSCGGASPPLVPLFRPWNICTLRFFHDGSF